MHKEFVMPYWQLYCTHLYIIHKGQDLKEKIVYEHLAPFHKLTDNVGMMCQTLGSIYLQCSTVGSHKTGYQTSNTEISLLEIQSSLNIFYLNMLNTPLVLHIFPGTPSIMCQCTMNVVEYIKMKLWSKIL